MEEFPDWLEQSKRQNVPLLLVLDAVTSMVGDETQLEWLPRILPTS